MFSFIIGKSELSSFKIKPIVLTCELIGNQILLFLEKKASRKIGLN